MPVVCTHCQSENVQAARAIVAAGTQSVSLRTNSSSGHHGAASGTAQTQLAAMLSEPPRPGGQLHAIAWVVCGVIAGSLKGVTRSDGLGVVAFVVLMTLYSIFIFRPLKQHWL